MGAESDIRDDSRTAKQVQIDRTRLGIRIGIESKVRLTSLVTIRDTIISALMKSNTTNPTKLHTTHRVILTDFFTIRMSLRIKIRCLRLQNYYKKIEVQNILVKKITKVCVCHFFYVPLQRFEAFNP